MVDLPVYDLPALMEELQRCRADHSEAQVVAAESEASHALELQDARLLQVRLSAILQRYRGRSPSIEDVARRYETELEELESEVQMLRESNVHLATRSPEDTDLHVSSGSGTTRAARNRRVLTVVEELGEEARELRLVQLQACKRARHTRVNEWTLETAKTETRKAAARFKTQEHRLGDLRSRHVEAEAHLRSLLEAQTNIEKELEVERERVRQLHCQALGMREASFVPAKLKKETTFLMKALDKECGGKKTRSHLRSLEAYKRLYVEVAHSAPSLLPLVGRAKADMEQEFARYLQLEKGHSRALQRLQLALTRGLQHPDESVFDC